MLPIQKTLVGNMKRHYKENFAWADSKRTD
jgi:hypothetical protein